MEQNDTNGGEALANAYEMLDLEEEDDVLVVALMALPSAKHNLTMVGTITSEIIIGHAKSHCLRKRRGYEVTGEKPFGPWLRATKGPKQWKENKWLVPAEKGICSDSKATSGNREDNMQPSTGEGGSHHTTTREGIH
ncbi:unnamed protein product [Cuscuta epithymum]|uniref:Uncharacterized protein n=1 Tax=Cuscuta epithymum TaxID=186058 RepID=A0AAV0FJ75_9ASTE|nr:unnamed protein product [Cuscuta epithymum]